MDLRESWHLLACMWGQSSGRTEHMRCALRYLAEDTLTPQMSSSSPKYSKRETSSGSSALPWAGFPFRASIRKVRAAEAALGGGGNTG